MGFLIDEKEFEVKPAISRAFTLFEVETGNKSRRAKEHPENPNTFDLDVLFRVGVTSLSEVYPYTIDLSVLETINVSDYSVYINDNFIGDELTKIQINTNDTIRIDVIKIDDQEEAILKCRANLLYSD